MSQWSLALAARKSITSTRLRPLDAGRNGAWPWRPGKVQAIRDGNYTVLGVAMEPGLGGQEKPNRTPPASSPHRLSQWSLALAARKSCLAGRPSMRSCAGRNGAWPWRPGKASPHCAQSMRYKKSQWSLALAARKSSRTAAAPTATAGRNGAWPWRPGKEGAPRQRPQPDPRVAMEPGLGGQEKLTP